MFKFEVFKRDTEHIVHRPVVTLGKGGVIGFNAYLVDTFKLGGYGYVVLHYDEGNRVLGIEPVVESVRGRTYLLRHRKSRGADVVARAFFHHIGFEVSESSRYDALWDDSYGMVIVELGQR
jgi:hypothetical protein